MKLWIYNNGRKRQEKKLSQARKYTFRHVVAHERKDDVEEAVRRLSGSTPGTTEYFKKYQSGLKELCDALSKEDILKYKEMAKEWTGRCPPKEIQRS